MPDLLSNNSPITDHSKQLIGYLLIHMEKLLPENIEQVLLEQKRQSIRFGEAAIALNLVIQEDVQHALSKQFSYTYLQPEAGVMSPKLVAAYHPFTQAAEALRSIRSQLMMHWFNDPSHKTLAIVSSSSKEGKSYFAANLAITFSHLRLRTLLIDANLRTPNQHKIFNLSNHNGLSALLAGHIDNASSIQAVPCCQNLSLIVSGAIPPNPLELLSQQKFEQLISDNSSLFDVILFDTPPGEQYSDAQVIAYQSNAAVLVTRKHQTQLQSADDFIRLLQNTGVEMVGIVTNFSIHQPLWDMRLKDFIMHFRMKMSHFFKK